MEDGICRVNLQRGERFDLAVVPALIGIPAKCDHVVGKGGAEARIAEDAFPLGSRQDVAVLDDLKSRQIRHADASPSVGTF